MKVQSPEHRDRWVRSRALGEIADFSITTRGRSTLRVHRLLEELGKIVICGELDYRGSAQPGGLSRDMLKDSTHVIVRRQSRITARRELLETIEYVQASKSRMSPLTRWTFDGEILAGELFRAYLHQILV